MSVVSGGLGDQNSLRRKESHLIVLPEHEHISTICYDQAEQLCEQFG